MKTQIVALSIALLCMTTTSFGQQDTTWNKWDWLVGDWVGEGSGMPGQGGGWFSFQPDLDGRILVRKSHSEYPATNNRAQITHDDLMVVYLDNAGKPSKAIYFDNEDHAINYAITYSEKSIVLTSDKIQNSPIFRLTYISLDKEAISVRFEISQDGEKFQTYVEGRCSRKK